MRAWVAALAFWALPLGAALAMPPVGTDLNSPEHRWWDCMAARRGTHGTGIICCDIADGHVMKDQDVEGRWDKDGKRHWWIRVGGPGQWWQVPEEAMVDPRPCGLEPQAELRAEAKAWFKVKCDWPGENRNDDEGDHHERSPWKTEISDCGDPVDHILDIVIYCFISPTTY